MLDVNETSMACRNNQKRSAEVRGWAALIRNGMRHGRKLACVDYFFVEMSLFAQLYNFKATRGAGWKNLLL
jgi:hypothetical protein